MLPFVGSSGRVFRQRGLLNHSAFRLRQQKWTKRDYLSCHPLWKGHVTKQLQRLAYVVGYEKVDVTRAQSGRCLWTCQGRRCRPLMKTSGIRTTSDEHFADNYSQEKASLRNGGSAKTPTPTPTSMLTSGADVTEGTRVRLRDTGRLGIVVGQKRGGWWVVEILEGSSSGECQAGDGHRRPQEKRNKNSMAKSVTTRRANMEPLGDAYGPSDASSPMPRGGGGQGETRARRSGEKLTRGKDSAGAHIAANGGESGMLPPVLRGQTISLPQAANEPHVIRSMSSDGMPHAAMKEWLVFSDLHVGPSSLAVSLEVRTLFFRQGFVHTRRLDNKLPLPGGVSDFPSRARTCPACSGIMGPIGCSIVIPGSFLQFF